MLQSKMLQLELILRFPSLGNGLVFLFCKLLAFGLMYSLLHPNSARLNSHMIPALIVPDKKLVNGVYTSVFSRNSDLSTNIVCPSVGGWVHPSSKPPNHQ